MRKKRNEMRKFTDETQIEMLSAKQGKKKNKKKDQTVDVPNVKAKWMRWRSSEIQQIWNTFCGKTSEWYIV